MLSQLKIGHPSSGKRPSPLQWPSMMASNCLFTARRFLGHPLCRLPFLALWSLIVIFLLFVVLNNSDTDHSESSSQLLPVAEYASAQQRPFPVEDSPHLTGDNKLSARLTSKPPTNSHVILEPIGGTKDLSKQYGQANRKIPASQVFILLIEDETLRSSSSGLRGRSNVGALPVYGGLQTAHRTIIPQHVRLLMSILDSHQIGYSIDTTHNGVPTSLYDQLNRSGDVRFSVVIVDSFVRYTRLSHWVRNQFDRHCRANKIGIISFVNSDEIIQQNLDSGLRRRFVREHSNKSTTSETPSAHNFPLSFTAIPHLRRQCRNSSYANCLYDLRINERVPLLKILKSRKDFIIHGPLPDNLNLSPWIRMEASHHTFEPLVFAKLRSAGTSTNGKNSHPIQSQRDEKHRRYGSPLEYVAFDSQDDPPHNDILGEFENDSGDSYVQLPAAGDTVGFYPINDSLLEDEPVNRTADKQVVLAMFDQGLYDGIQRIVFGFAPNYWLSRTLILEAIEHLSSNRITNSLDRYIQIDIDDIFVAEKGKRMNASDVNNLINVQRLFSKRIEGGFKFNLGYSGKFFKHGTNEENEGDARLVEKASEFTWFCHTWSHSKAHLFNDTQSIANELRKNYQFAQEHSLPISNGTMPTGAYAIAPHHSGVYPIHDQLYEAWRSALNVQVTSTEEYPHLRPASGRRGFVYKTIKVLPRQTCGLYTHTVYRSKYPGGIGRLDASIRGGELFETVLHNPVNIYMTHMSNYANDRLAPYAFAELLDFVQKNTNLRLRYAPSSQIADYYFSLHPDNLEPLWTDPCSDKRHLAIWAMYKERLFCPVVPSLLIVGPQKTGTTALHAFLQLNNQFKSSIVDPDNDFEEVQFFNDKHYAQGVDWYYSRFIQNGSASNEEWDPEKIQMDNGSRPFYYYFDKSATYFDDPNVPQRAKALLPNAKVIILLSNPADRAYSWYQHMRAHDDRLANALTFEQVVTGAGGAAGTSLRNRCLHPGYYSQHLTRWLHHYPSRQVIIIDSQWFRDNPASVMHKLQLLLLGPQRATVDYHQRLVFDHRKGFFCERDPRTGGAKCLGRSKGRHYAPMSQTARNWLNRHYLPHNRQLAQLLTDIGQPWPLWLESAMNVPEKDSI